MPEVYSWGRPRKQFKTHGSEFSHPEEMEVRYISVCLPVCLSKFLLVLVEACPPGVVHTYHFKLAVPTTTKHLSTVLGKNKSPSWGYRSWQLDVVISNSKQLLVKMVHCYLFSTCLGEKSNIKYSLSLKYSSLKSISYRIWVVGRWISNTHTS